MQEEDKIERQMGFGEIKKWWAHGKKKLEEIKRRVCCKALFSNFLVLGTSLHFQKLLRTPKVFAYVDYIYQCLLFIYLEIKTDILKSYLFKKE